MVCEYDKSTYIFESHFAIQLNIFLGLTRVRMIGIWESKDGKQIRGNFLPRHKLLSIRTVYDQMRGNCVSNKS